MRINFLKQGFLFLALGLSIVAFHSCDDDDNNNVVVSDGTIKIEGTNVNVGSVEVKTIAALGSWYENDNNYGEVEIATSPFVNNGFELQLQAAPPSECLELFFGGETDKSVEISDKNVKAYELTKLHAYDKEGEVCGRLELTASDNATKYGVTWMYVDSDVKIKGERMDNVKYGRQNIWQMDLNLKKGGVE